MNATHLTAWALPLALLTLEPSPTPAPSPVAAPAAPAPPRITLPTLARSLESDLSRVRSLEAAVQPSTRFGEIQRSLPALDERLAALEAKLLAARPDNLSFRELDLIRISWLDLDRTLSDWEAALEREADTVDDAGGQLTAIQADWTAALASDWHDRLPAGLVEKIDGLLLKTAALRDSLRERTASLLIVQDDVSSGRARVREAIDRTFSLSKEVSESLFAVETDPLWAAVARERPKVSLGIQILESWRATITDFLRSINRDRGYFAFHILGFAALAGAVIFLSRRTRKDADADAEAKTAAEFLDRPFAAAGALTAFATFFTYPPTALAVHAAALAVLLIVYFRLVPKVVPPPQRPQAYGLGALFFLDRIHDFALPHSLLQRLILFAIGVLGVFGWVAAHRATMRAIARGATVWSRGWLNVARIAIVCLALASVANLIGNVSLAEQLTVVAVKGVFAGGILFVLSKILESMWVLVLRYLASIGSRMVARNIGLLERRGRFTIRTVSVGAWVIFLLWIMRIIEQSGQMFVALFSKRWTVGHVQVGLGAVVAFATALTLGIVAAKLIRFILDEAVFPRTTLPRGVPAAVSTTVGYLLITAGFVLAFLAAGLEMSQFTFLAGAFGVGIGFGLQNIVNNFVSGLILLYERPIQVGDVLTVGTLQGYVRRIGIRSSTLATFDGAEVIVPNATLIATDVVNWTLSDRLRRVEIKVGASYGSDPKQVLEVLNRVARSHSEVLASPAPNALFMGFGESSLEFELRVWTPDYDAYVRVGSELRSAIFAAFREAGIEIPFPQRDVHLKSLDPTTVRTLGGPTKSG